MLTADTFPRPQNIDQQDDPAALYVRSYLIIRTVVGFIGILLPLVFIVGENYYLQDGLYVRGSISEYYHSPMRDFFVAGLCVIGFLLATYMSAQTKTWDFWLSLVAGVAVIGVVFFPTRRVDLESGAPLCGDHPAPPGCTWIQQELGETVVATAHFACAAVFIGCLAAIAFLFAHREQKYVGATRMVLVQRLCGWAIIVAVVWIAVGGFLDLNIWQLTPLYLGEVVSVWAFGVSWLLKGKDLRGTLFPGRRRERRGAGAVAQQEEPHLPASGTATHRG